MKILDKYSAHEEIHKNGYVFDPEITTFYSKNGIEFIKPVGYEDWTVEIFDFSAYGKERFEKYGIDEKNNKINLFGTPENPNSNEDIEEDIFTINEQGNIEILQFSLYRKPIFKKLEITTAQERSGTSKGTRYTWQERINPVYETVLGAKYDFSNAVNAPFWHPDLINYFHEEKPVEMLVITEGQFKSWEACRNGLHCVGLTSISHFRNSETNSLHPEIIHFIQKCKVKKVVVLWDGDCLNISSSDLVEKQELTKRPNNFYKFAQTIRFELKKYIKSKDFRIFFSTIHSHKLDGEPKGIDDLFFNGINKEKVISEFENIGFAPNVFIHWEDITNDEGVKSMRRFFGLDNVTKFFQKHIELIKQQSFVFFGSTYKIEKGVPVVEVSKDLKTIKRIGDEYYQLIDVPVPNGKKGEVIHENRLIGRKKGEINQDHGKDCFNNIEKFKGFTNVANHVDFQSVISGHWNLYYNVDHKTEKGEFPTIKKFLLHLFEEHEENEMIYDYLSVLYRNPMQKLPVICLVSKEQETGKSTFIYLLKLIFKQNLAIISNSDLVSEFNSHWTSSLIVASEETLLEKKDGYEKIKSLSTAFEINRNEKNKTSQPIPCMIHFVFCSNHEEDFIKIDDYDSRLWIRKIGKRKETIDNFDQLLENEIPQFVHFLEAREIKYKSKGDRLFFKAKDFETSAKKVVIQNSEPGVIKEIRTCLNEYFDRFGKDECLMTTTNIKQYFGIKGEHNYLRKIIKIYLKPEKWKNSEGIEGSTTYSFCTPDHDPHKVNTISDKGRPYVFKRKDYLES